jgi:two-component system, chemotaxis family, CheB/CheR fusion protein
MPADALFKSLARARGERAISVVLSGGDSDGSLGTQFIKHGGGITFAQDPTTARFPSMPRNAIDTGCVDYVLTPRHIAHELTRLIRHPYFQSRAAMQPLEPAVDFEAPTDEGTFRRIFRRLRAAHGVDFTHYKRSTLQRRLARRMVLQKVDSITQYAELIESDAEEAANLYKDFLIRVTEFFRDPESFDLLSRDVFPELSADRSPKDPIRIWVPGCSTGEEVYSVAIALVEYLGERLVPGSVQLFGTDVSETAVEHARAGVYLDSAVKDVSEARVKRFFVEEKDRYRIAKSIRDLCIFARQDVTKDPPFARLDLISCRNLLIYLDSPAQRRVMEIFHYALKPSAVLMLGPSETIGQAAELFELRDKQHRVYTRKSGSHLVRLDLGARPERRESGLTAADPVVFLKENSAERAADRVLLARYAPASLLVDEALNITQFRGETGPYLEHASGAPSFNLQRVIRTELLANVSSAIQEARETKAESRREGLSVDDRKEVKVSVIPLQRLSTEPSYLVLFEDGSRPMSGRRTQQPSSPPLEESEKDRLLAQARHEVAALRDYLQATMEEHEAVKEELKSAHEEVLSANEEFQSTNEELETSQEELQSSNEELSTTNDELIARNRELAELNSALEGAKADILGERTYADAIIESVSTPLLVLKADLTIIRANAAFYADFRVTPEDTLGKFLYDVGNGQWAHPELRRRLDNVLSNDEPMSEVEVEHHFPRIGHREAHRPENPRDGGATGAYLASDRGHYRATGYVEKSAGERSSKGRLPRDARS